MKYKVLSVRQPYASLLVSGKKDVENRSRRTNYRGTVLIHASAKEHDVISYLPRKREFTINEITILSTMGEVVEDYLFSCIVGSVDIVDCVQNHPSVWAEKGQWHWVCTNARKFEHPIRNVKGKLGIWEWEEEIEELKQ
jgi:hypothetical protein